MKKFWMILFACALTVQLGGFYMLDRFLGTGAVTTSSNVISTATALGTASAAKQPEEIKVQLPDVSADVRVYDIDSNGRLLAYADRHGQVIVKDNKQEIKALTQLDGVHYLQWMDAGSTLLYFREKYGMTEFGVYKVKEDQLLPLNDLPSADVQIQHVFVSPYSQSINMLYKQDGQLYVGYYEAIYGFRSRQLHGITIKDATFDAKTETMTFHEEDGTVWDFTSGRLKQRVDDTERLPEPETAVPAESEQWQLQ